MFQSLLTVNYKFKIFNDFILKLQEKAGSTQPIALNRAMTDNSNDDNAQTNDQISDFGFTKVPTTQKAAMVETVFSNVASRYDLMNDLMSLGAHHLWKRQLIHALRPHPSRHLLDVAGGTGDIATGFLQAGGGRATLLDINESMVAAGIERAINQGKLPLSDPNMPDYLIGDAQALPLTSQAVDLYSIAFGLRNVTDIKKAIAEAYRVLKPGGQYFCLEFSKVSLPIIAQLYDQYSFNILPKLGKFVANDEAAYRYLVESIRKFPPQDQLVQLLQDAGFKRVRYHNMSFGVVALHRAWKY